MGFGPGTKFPFATDCDHWISHGLDKGKRGAGAGPDGVCPGVLEESGRATLIHGSGSVVKPVKEIDAYPHKLLQNKTDYNNTARRLERLHAA